MATETKPEKKRRLKASPETIRGMADKANREERKPERDKSENSGKLRQLMGAILKPLMWLGRHTIPRYFRNSFKELGNVTWPARKQSRQLTTAVIAFAIVFGVFVTLLDYGFDKVFKKVFLHE